MYLVQFLLPWGLVVQAPLGHLEVLYLLPVFNKINDRKSSYTTYTERKRYKKKTGKRSILISFLYIYIKNQDRKISFFILNVS